MTPSFNHGQTCCAGSRIYVQRPIYDKFVAGFKAQTEKLKVGDPFASDSYQGPQVSQLQYDRIMSYVESGKQEGAKIITGGERHGKEGYFIKPVSAPLRLVSLGLYQTIFGDVTANMKIVKEEIFGPVVVLSAFDTEDEVVEYANDSIYGLASSVFTTDLNRALRVANRLKVTPPLPSGLRR